jgi:hypothetical protein
MATVAVDFDGVIHAYSKGWQDGAIYDDPVPGAFEALRALMDDYAVVIHTSRDQYQVEGWLAAHGFSCMIDNESGDPGFWNEQGVLLVSRRKYPAIAYIDDRGIRFESWDQALADLARHESGGPPGPGRAGLDKVRDAVRAARGGDAPRQIQGYAWPVPRNICRACSRGQCDRCDDPSCGCGHGDDD